MFSVFSQRTINRRLCSCLIVWVSFTLFLRYEVARDRCAGLRGGALGVGLVVRDLKFGDEENLAPISQQWL